MKKLIKIVLILFILLNIVNCNLSENKKIDGIYNQFIINEDSNIVIIKYPISKQYFKNTSLLLKKNNRDTLIFGNFDKNKKSGLWIYNFENSNSFNIYWEEYFTENIITIKDKSWEKIENGTNNLGFEFNINKNSKFYVVKYKDFRNIKPTQYFDLMIKQYQSQLNLDLLDFQLTYTDEPSLFIKTKYSENEKKYLMFNFVKKINGIFYDFTLATIDLDNELKYNFLFLEIIQNTAIDSNLILNPFKDLIIKKFER